MVDQSRKRTPSGKGYAMDKDDLIRAYRNHSGTWPALLGLYGLVVAGFFASAYAIL